MSSNSLQNRAGLMTQARRTQRALSIARELVNHVPALDAPQYRPLVLNFARLTVLIEHTFGVLDEGPLLSEVTGEVRQSVNTYRQLLGELRALASTLGISPTTAILLAKQARPMLDLDEVRDVEER